MFEFRMPQFGMGMTDGTIVSWYKEEGDILVAGEPFVEIEAAKTTVEVPAPSSGMLEKILVPVDGKVPVNTPIALIEQNVELGREDQRVMRRQAALAKDAPKASPLARRVAQSDGVDLKTVQGSGPRGRVMASDVAHARPALVSVQIEPRARRAAKELGVDLLQITGSGPRGRIIEEDVCALSSRSRASEPDRSSFGAESRLEKHSEMRRTIALRLTQSKQTVPHFYLRASCIVDALLGMKAEINAGQNGVKVSLNDFIVRAVALALKTVPAANLSWTEEGMLHHDDIDIAIAVATPKGLVTPIIRQVDRKPILALSREIKTLTERGRAGGLLPNEYEGGSSTVSNLGMYGTEEFAAIVNPPQASIFAIGTADERAVVRKAAIETATVMRVTLSVDHRAIDGAIAAELLAAFKALVERPALILA